MIWSGIKKFFLILALFWLINIALFATNTMLLASSD